jgi:transcription antitermination factor NusG
MVLKTPGVFSIYEQNGRPFPIPDSEVLRLQRTVALKYPVECSEHPSTGDVVEIGTGDDAIRGVLVERGPVYKVVIGFDVLRRAVSVRIPLDDLKHTDGRLASHWSLKSV